MTPGTEEAVSKNDLSAPELEVWLCPVHDSLDKCGNLKPLDNCVACIRVQRDELLAEVNRLLYWLLRCYHVAYRQGWEEGPTERETMESVHSVLCNRDLDPNLSKDAKKLLATPEREIGY